MAATEKTLAIMLNKRTSGKKQRDAAKPDRSNSGGTAPVSDSAVNGIEFSEVYRQYLRPVYAFVAYRVDDRSAAEDITSKVFEKALAAFSRYDSGRAALSTWLFTIARNSVTDYFRNRKKHVYSELNEDGAQSSEGNPEKELFAQEMRHELAQAFSHLSQREHEVVALKFGAGMTNRKIGGLLGISETNAGTILFRSLNKLKDSLEGGIEND